MPTRRQLLTTLLTRRHLLEAVLVRQQLLETVLTRQQLLAGGTLPLAGAAAAQTRPATTWRVGPGQALTRIADALAQAGDGDKVEILPGTYRGDVAVIRQQRLTITGIGERPLLLADGQHAEGKAIWVLRGGDVRVENIAFRGARVPDGNGAGIRLERGHLHLQRCAFADHEIGLLTSNDETSTLAIEHCDFSDAPVNTLDLSHLLYVGRIAHCRISRSRFWQGREGHLIKCRARETQITDNLLDDGPLGEASYEIDLPVGGKALVQGNTVVQSPHSRNAVMLSYGAEGRHWPQNSLTLRNNRFINRLPSAGWFVRVWADRLPPGTPVLSQGNHYLGPGSLVLGPEGQSQDDVMGPLP